MSDITAQVQREANDNTEDSSDTHILGVEISTLTSSHSFAWPRSYHEIFENFIKEHGLTKKDSTPPKKLKQYTRTILERFRWKDYQGILAKNAVSVQSIIEQNIEAQLKRMLRQIPTPSTRQSNRIAGKAPAMEQEQRFQLQGTTSLSQTTTNLRNVSHSSYHSSVKNLVNRFESVPSSPASPNPSKGYDNNRRSNLNATVRTLPNSPEAM